MPKVYIMNFNTYFSKRFYAACHIFDKGFKIVCNILNVFTSPSRGDEIYSLIALWWYLFLLLLLKTFSFVQTEKITKKDALPNKFDSEADTRSLIV